MNAFETPQACVTAGFTAVLMARVVDWQAMPLQRADVAAVEYTIFELDEADPTSRLPVPGHEDVSLSSAELDASVFDALQTTDKRWTVDAEGYNFRFQPSAAISPPFPTPGRAYLATFRFSPTSGEDDFPVNWYLRAF